MATIANMTYDDLKKFVEDAIDERLTQLLGRFEITDNSDEEDNPSWDEIRARADFHRWTPPPGAKSSLEMLREDRDS